MENSEAKGLAITGEGIVCAIGLDKASVLQSLMRKHSGVGTMRYLQSVHKDLPVGEVKMSTEEMRARVGITSELVGRTPLMGIMAIEQALTDAGLSREYVEREALRVVLVSGTTVAGMDITEQCFPDIMERACRTECLAYHDCGCSTRLMAEHVGVFADYTTISTACSSAANSFILGARLITDGEADIVVVGGSEALSRFHFTGFNSLMILDKQVSRPFDAKRAGLNLGEGAAFVVMETVASARKRGVEAHAYLCGFGNACDAYHQTATSAEGNGAFRAMKEALRVAQMTPSDIDYVNAHGTGTYNNDATESVAIRRVFGNDLPKVSSTKPFTGHTTSASGSIEAVICILAMNHGFIPANLGWANCDEGTIVPSLGEDHVELRNVMCNAFGFGGNDSVLVFSKANRTIACDRQKASAMAVKELSRVEVTSGEQLAEIKKYVKPIESRRMGKLMKAAIVSSMQALQRAGVACPDAIVTATARGCLDNTEKFAWQIYKSGETLLSPTLFMQSTHNTVASMIAMRLKCHGYNITYSQESESLSWAIKDARMLIEEGNAKTVLVECHDEVTDTVSKVTKRKGVQEESGVKSISIVLSC